MVDGDMHVNWSIVTSLPTCLYDLLHIGEVLEINTTTTTAIVLLWCATPGVGHHPSPLSSVSCCLDSYLTCDWNHWYPISLQHQHSYHPISLMSSPHPLLTTSYPPHLLIVQVQFDYTFSNISFPTPYSNVIFLKIFYSKAFRN